MLQAAQHWGPGRCCGTGTLVFKGRSSENWSLEWAAGDVLGETRWEGARGQRKGLPRTVGSLARAVSQLGGSWTSPTAPQSLSFPICQMTLRPASRGDQRDGVRRRSAPDRSGFGEAAGRGCLLAGAQCLWPLTAAGMAGAAHRAPRQQEDMLSQAPR